ncbi:MAG: XdhC/CoxI family protein [Longimicrobiales bacterium]
MNAAPPPRVSPAAAARRALDALGGGPAVALITVLDADAVDLAGTRMMLSADGTLSGSTGMEALDAATASLARRVLEGVPPFVTEVERAGTRLRVYIEGHLAPQELLIVGAGHIAVPLAALGTRLGFRVTVLDDREEFTTAERFPGTHRVLHTDFADPFRDVAISDRSWIVLVTRAHRYDYDCLCRLLEGDVAPRYVGMIGSRRRVRAAFAALLDAGVARDRIARVAAPIGLDIGAETPEEIAVSVAAEVISLLRGSGTGRRLSEQERVLDRLLPDTTSQHIAAPEP